MTESRMDGSWWSYYYWDIVGFELNNSNQEGIIKSYFDIKSFILKNNKMK